MQSTWTADSEDEILYHHSAEQGLQEVERARQDEQRMFDDALDGF